MPDGNETATPPEHRDGIGWASARGPISAVCAALVALAAIYVIWDRQAGGRIALGGPTGFSIEISPSDDLIDLIDRALATQPDDFKSLLAGREIYHIESAQLVDALRNADADSAVGRRVRGLLYKLEGPFALPNTLAQATAQFYEAIERLDDFDERDPETVANPFLTTVVMRHLGRSGIFRQRAFNAEVFLLHGAPERDDGPSIAYACPGSELQGLEIMLFLDEPDRLSGLVPFEVRGDSRVRCVGSSQTFSRFLARHPARIGISAEGFERLYGTVKPGATLPSRVSARFEVKPKDFRPVVVLPSEVRHDL